MRQDDSGPDVHGVRTSSLRDDAPDFIETRRATRERLWNRSLKVT
jgi:hypothetical protein